MKATLGTLFGRTLIVAALTVSTATLTSTAALASTAHASNGQTVCDVVLNPSVRIESKIPCVVQIRLGGSARVDLGSGFRWGDPVSSSRAVVVTSIARNSIGVDSAVLHAAVVGRATIHDTGTEYCKTGVACPQLALLWTLRIVVTKTL